MFRPVRGPLTRGCQGLWDDGVAGPHASGRLPLGYRGMPVRSRGNHPQRSDQAVLTEAGIQPPPERMAIRPTGNGEDLPREEIARRLHTSQARHEQEEEIEKARREARNFADRLGDPEARGPWRETRLDRRVAGVDAEVRSILREMDLGVQEGSPRLRWDLGRLALIGLFAMLAIVLNVLSWLQELLPTSPTSMVSKGG